MTRPTKPQAIQEIDHVIEACEQSVRIPDAYGYLPIIIIALKRMRNELTVPVQNQEKRKQEAAGLGRIVLDSTNFADTELGTAIFEVIRHYVEISYGK